MEHADLSPGNYFSNAHIRQQLLVCKGHGYTGKLIGFIYQIHNRI